MIVALDELGLFFWAELGLARAKGGPPAYFIAQNNLNKYFRPGSDQEKTYGQQDLCPGPVH
jgi:hypothetical protein